MMDDEKLISAMAKMINDLSSKLREYEAQNLTKGDHALLMRAAKLVQRAEGA